MPFWSDYFNECVWGRGFKFLCFRYFRYSPAVLNVIDQLFIRNKLRIIMSHLAKLSSVA